MWKKAEKNLVIEYIATKYEEYTITQGGILKGSRVLGSITGLMCDKDISRNFKVALYKIIVWSTALYESEAWIMNKNSEDGKGRYWQKYKERDKQKKFISEKQIWCSYIRMMERFGHFVRM